MAINLLNNSIGNIHNGNGSIQTGNAGGTSALMRQAAAAILKETAGLSAGDTIQGQLVSKDGSSIELLLGNNARLTTMLEQDMNLSLGQLLSFEVKSNQGGQLTLRPLFANMSNSSTIMSALDAAGIAANDTTIEMVDTLMQNGMPVNKELLNTINRELSMYPDADVSDIIMLHKMDIPVNEGNVRQMHLHNNNNQWMMESVSDSASELTGLLTDALLKGGEDAQNIMAGLKQLLPPMDGQAEDIAHTGADGELSQSVTGGVGPNTEGGVSTAIAADSDVSQMTDISKGALDAQAATDKPAQNIGAGNADSAMTDVKAADGSADTNADGRVISKFNVFDKLSELKPEELNKPEIKAQIKNAVTELLKDNMLMKPEDIKEDKFVQKYYERTMNLADGLEKLMQQNGKSDADFTRSMTNMKENTTFMNHINDMYNYVQLPLKMNEAQANGDLYVYARKKGRSGEGEDGRLTALLHLSMEHLGNMDIFLTLTEGQKLNTKFTLEKEEMIDFIASHIDELNARLEKKGYNVGTVVTHKDGPDKTVIENITGDENNILLSTQSFDARA